MLQTFADASSFTFFVLFKAGILPKFLEFIRDKVKDMPEIKKYCIVGWDEVAVKAHLDYNHSKDTIDGFVDLANEKRPNFATRSLTFMMRGISEPFKQHISTQTIYSHLSCLS